MKKLREYKGVVYQDGAWHFIKTNGIARSAVNACHFFIINATDDDYAALMDLKANPYEPPYQTLKRILSDCLHSKMSVSEVAEVIRAAFPQIDGDHIGDANKMVVEEKMENNNVIHEFEVLVNKYSFDTKTNTPDYILAEYLYECLMNYVEVTWKNDIHRKASDENKNDNP